MEREAWHATVHGGHKESDMTRQLTFHLIFLGVESRIQYFQNPQLLSEEKAENHRMKEQVLFNNYYFFFKEPTKYLFEQKIGGFPSIHYKILHLTR